MSKRSQITPTEKVNEILEINHSCTTQAESIERKLSGVCHKKPIEEPVDDQSLDSTIAKTRLAEERLLRLLQSINQRL